MRHNVEFTLSRAGGLQQHPRHFLRISSIVLWQIMTWENLKFSVVLNLVVLQAA